MATQEQLTAAVEQLTRQLSTLEQRLQTSEAEKAVVAQEVGELRDRAQAGERPGARIPRLVDSRAIGRPQNFDGDTSKYADWAFVLKAYVSALGPDYGPAFDQIEGSTLPLYNATLTQREVQMSSQFY